MVELRKEIFHKLNNFLKQNQSVLFFSNKKLSYIGGHFEAFTCYKEFH